MEVVRTYYDKGQLYEEYCLINNKIEGLYKTYNINEQIDILLIILMETEMENINHIMM